MKIWEKAKSIEKEKDRVRVRAKAREHYKYGDVNWHFDSNKNYDEFNDFFLLWFEEDGVWEKLVEIDVLYISMYNMWNRRLGIAGSQIQNSTHFFQRTQIG